jgi:hypothetical protein
VQQADCANWKEQDNVHGQQGHRNIRAGENLPEAPGTGCPCSFREACIAYGVGDPKAECDGSQVQDLVARGDIDAVHRYCRSDVVFLRKLHKAMRGLLS